MGEPRADQDPWLCVLPFHHFHPQPQRPDPDIPDMLKLLDELIEQRYGDLQPQRSPAQSVHGEEPDPDHARGPAMNEDMGPANDLAKALALVHSGARASSMHERCDLDLEEDLPQMTGFDMAKLLWPHQKAAVGRMRTILEKYKAVALFFEMGLGKTLIVIALLVSLGVGDRPRKAPTLVVVPRSLLGDWKANLEQSVSPALRVCVYHDGKIRGKTTTTNHTVAELETYDVVLTTYSIVRNQCERTHPSSEAWDDWRRLRVPFDYPKRCKYPLFAIRWFVLALEEAHVISNPTTKGSSAACALLSQHRVAITGTALSNEYTEVHGLLKFLRLEPWSWLRIFKEYFIQKSKSRSHHADELDDARTTVLAATLLAVSLRMKITDSFDGARVAQFLPPKVWVVNHSLTREQAEYQEVVRHLWDPVRRAEVAAQKRAGTYVPRLDPKDVFPAMMNARLSTVHPECPNANYGELGESDIADGPGTGLSGAQIEDMEMRVRDGDGIEDGTDRKSANRGKSAEKRKAFRDKMATDWPSPRMHRMLEVVRTFRTRHGGKMIIFSDHLCVLDVVHAALSSEGYEVLRYDGWANQADREAAIERFETEGNGIDFLLMTSRAGGLGLNLPIAKAVMFSSPSWSYALTAQCAGRAVRPGQNRVVQVYKFVAPQSFEKHVRHLSNKKKRKASGILDPTPRVLDNIKKAASWDQREFEKMMAAAAEEATRIRRQMEKRRQKAEERQARRRRAQEHANAAAALRHMRVNRVKEEEHPDDAGVGPSGNQQRERAGSDRVGGRMLRHRVRNGGPEDYNEGNEDQTMLDADEEFGATDDGSMDMFDDDEDGSDFEADDDIGASDSDDSSYADADENEWRKEDEDLG